MGVIATVSIGVTDYSVYAITSDALQDASDYFQGHVGGQTWLDAEADDQKKALISAFRAFERLMWEGTKSGSPQSTKFPRDGLTDCEGDSLPDDSIPDDIAYGEFELAYLLMLDPSILNRQSTRSDVRRAKADTAEVEFFLAPAGEETKMPTVVHDLISCFLSGTGSDVGLPFASGTDVESSFDAEDMDRSDGYA